MRSHHAATVVFASRWRRLGGASEPHPHGPTEPCGPCLRTHPTDKSLCLRSVWPRAKSRVVAKDFCTKVPCVWMGKTSWLKAGRNGL